MRTEEEMLELIQSVADSDERIRAVYMNGSRVNPNIEKDKYQDYDIVFVVTETASFLFEKSWIDVFGEISIVQEPDSNDLGWGIEHDFSKSYAWLMLFKDGTRIDLTIIVKTAALENYFSDTLTVKLLDKDNILPELPTPSDKSHWIKPPTKEQYRGCCNEFWWCLNNVAKGIVRKQLPYAMRMYMETVHKELERMTEWYIGINNDFSVSSGMWGRSFEKYLPQKLYAMYAKTYSCGDYDELWIAISSSCDMFRIIAPAVGDHLGYIYQKHEDENTTDYMNKLRSSK